MNWKWVSIATSCAAVLLVLILAVMRDSQPPVNSARVTVEYAGEYGNAFKVYILTDMVTGRKFIVVAAPYARGPIAMQPLEDKP